MNFLKKNYKIIIFFGLICLFIVGGCIILFNKTSDKCEIITLKNDYYVVNTDKNNYINVPLYFSVKDSVFVDQDEIDSVYIVNDVETEIIPVSIIEINYLKEIIYEQKTYYQYDLKLEIDFIINNLTILDNVYLKITYNSMDFIKILIGNLSMYNYQLNDEMYYTNLKGITKTYNDVKMLAGIVVKLECVNDVTIFDILPMNSQVEIDLEKAFIIAFNDLDNVNELVSGDYNIIGSGNKNNELIVTSGDYLFIPLKYKDYTQIQVQGFVIKYLESGVVKEKVITPFMYFKTSNSNREIIKIIYERN